MCYATQTVLETTPWRESVSSHRAQGEASWSWASSAEWSHVKGASATGRGEATRALRGEATVLCGQTSAGF